MMDYRTKMIIADTLLMGLQDIYYKTAPFPIDPRLLSTAEYYRPLLLQERGYFMRAQSMYDQKQRVGASDLGTLESMIELGNMKLEGLLERAGKTVAEINSMPQN
jgi:hypothetical protein